MDERTLFGLMIFIVVLLMSQTFVAPLMGSRKAAKQRLRQRIRALGETLDGETHAAQLRKKQLQELSRFERWLESLSLMDRLAALVTQADLPVYALGGVSANVARRLAATRAVGIAAIGAFTPSSESA